VIFFRCKCALFQFSFFLILAGLIPPQLYAVTLQSAHQKLTTSLPNTAFYYGQTLPITALSNYDQVVVQPSNVTEAELKALKQTGTRVLAYLSVGEVAQSSQYYPQIQADWVVGKNPHWNSDILDLRKMAVLNFLLTQRMQSLKNAGYDGLFLDTLDSYQLVAKTSKDRKDFEKGLSTLIKGLRRNWKSATILVNRGFELMPIIASQINGVVVESLFSGFGGEHQGYKQVSEKDRKWMIAKLKEIKRQYHLPITVIDYLPDNQWSKSEKLALKIYNLGFMPWVADGHLNEMGRGYIAPVPRKILALYDDKKNSIYDSDTHRKLAEPLEYMGYQLDYINVNHDPLPAYSLRGRYAGIVTWFSGEDIKPSNAQLCQWFKSQIDIGLKIALFGEIPPQAECKKLFNMKEVLGVAGKKFKAIIKQKSVGQFEAKLRIRRFQVPDLASTNKKSTPWLKLRSKEGKVIDPILIDNWGGWALSPYATVDAVQGISRWQFNPFRFLRDSLRLPIIPVVDISTESGRRIMTIHIDGDGFVSRAEMAGREYAGKVILDEIIKRYRYPTTASVIEGEVGEKGLYKSQSPALEKIAKEIFRQPNVEGATHTYSHPFFWQIFDGDYDVGKATYGYNMPIPHYKPSLKREIIGSADYINQHLMPSNKRVKMILWSGNTLPGASAVKMATDAGLLNVNGGDTWPLPHRSSISMVWPVGRPTKGGLHVYAPVLNENVYTNDWHGPFYGYRNAITSFKLLNSPRRLKPIGIYYHYYSGSKIASLNALKQVYDWAIKQHPFPMYLSQYALRANAFYKASLAKRLDGGWQFNPAGYIHTLRLPPGLGWPDLSRSKGVAGYVKGVDGVYVSLNNGRAVLYLQSHPDKQLHLVESNAVIERWQPIKAKKKGELTGYQISLKSNLPIELSLAPQKKCWLKYKDIKYQPTYKKGRLIFSLKSKVIESAAIVCH
jgi:uncharacterized protein (TIGR01370 family)